MTPRLSPLDALLEAGLRIGQRRGALQRACAVPLGATLLASGVGSLVTGSAQIVLQLSSVALVALTAAHLHRVLAPARFVAPPQLAFGSSLRLWLRYLMWLLTLVITLSLAVTWLAEQAWGSGVPSEARLYLYLGVSFAVVAVGLYLNARLCLVLPAEALQRSPALWLAWGHSRGNAAALVVLLLLPERVQWLMARRLGTSTEGKLVASLLEALLLLGIATLLSVAWSRLTEPVSEARSRVPAGWATVLLGLPLLLSHAWSQAESHRTLRGLRAEMAEQARSEVASQRSLEASRAVQAGDRARGVQLYREARELYRSAGNAQGEAWSLVHVAANERELGNEAAARAALESALERARVAGEVNVESIVQKELAALPSSP
jgi:hypothetical protein